MLTIRLNGYTKEEISKLYEILDESMIFLRECYGNCGVTECADCPVRHACYDLGSAKKYLAEVVARNNRYKDKR